MPNKFLTILSDFFKNQSFYFEEELNEEKISFCLEKVSHS
jgi:hypothetical protein